MTSRPRRGEGVEKGGKEGNTVSPVQKNPFFLSRTVQSCQRLALSQKIDCVVSSPLL